MYLLVGSLAVVDLCVGIINLMLAVANTMLTVKGVQLSLRGTQNMCSVVILALWMAPVINSFYNLVLVAVDRYVAVLQPLRYEEFITTRRLKLLITCSWLLAYVQGFMVLAWRDSMHAPCDTGIMQATSSPS